MYDCPALSPQALEEPSFSIAYANLCKVMSPLKVEWEEEGKAKHTNFRRELLTKCQAEFERDKKDDEEHDKKQKAVDEAATPEEKKQLEDELEDFTTKARKRSLGNIRFIGELFKLQMLSETIMHECIVRLLKSTSDEESLECFARLITTTGKELDSVKARVSCGSVWWSSVCVCVCVSCGSVWWSSVLMWCACCAESNRRLLHSDIRHHQERQDPSQDQVHVTRCAGAEEE